MRMGSTVDDLGKETGSKPGKEGLYAIKPVVRWTG